MSKYAESDLGTPRSDEKTTKTEEKTTNTGSKTTKTLHKIINTLKEVSVEPLLFSQSLTIFLINLLSSQYFFYRISVEKGLISNDTGDSTCGMNGTHTLYEEVSSESSTWNAYCNIGGENLFFNRLNWDMKCYYLQ